MKRALLPAILLLAFPAGAFGGGWAAVNVDAPDGAAAGKVRPTKLTILQHGRTPLDGVSPVVRISKDATTREFPAAPTGAPGEYLAKVVYPTAGRWAVEVDDGFTQTHRIMPVDVAAAGPVGAADSSGAKRIALIAGGAVVVLILGVSALLLVSPERRAAARGLRRSRPASAS
jgi:hypothetical protein